MREPETIPTNDPKEWTEFKEKTLLASKRTVEFRFTPTAPGVYWITALLTSENYQNDTRDDMRKCYVKILVE